MSKDLPKILNSFKYPLPFIDFETTAVAVPYHAGMHPYEQVAFEWSCEERTLTTTQSLRESTVNVVRNGISLEALLTVNALQAPPCCILGIWVESEELHNSRAVWFSWSALVLFLFVKGSGDDNAIANMMRKNTIRHHNG
jgi:Domain of unknown function(DUF2779)